jgi:hypothetical protein
MKYSTVVMLFLGAISTSEAVMLSQQTSIDLEEFNVQTPI